MKKLLIVAAVVAALTWCEKAAETTKNVGEFKVERLFTFEGCTAYRFSDAGNRIYYTNCKGQASWETGTHKSRTKHQVSTDNKFFAGYEEEIQE